MRATATVRTNGQAAVRWGTGHLVPRVGITLAARRGDLHGRAMLHASHSQDLPVELFARIRDSGAFHRGGFSYVTGRLDVAKEVLASNDVKAGIEIGGGGPLARLGAWAQQSGTFHPLGPPSLLAIEPPDHTRLRKLVSRVFTVRAVQHLQQRTEEIATDLLDRLERRGIGGDPVDLVDAYAALLPVTVICEILGVPPEDRDRVRRYGTLAAPSLDVGLSWSRFREVERTLAEFGAWLEGHLGRVRRRPGDDLLSQLVAVRDDDGTALTDAELVMTAGLVLAAGFETTVNLIGNGVALLAAHPEQRAAAVAGEVSWHDVVEETLRYDPPVLLTGRTTVRDTVVAGTPIPGGSLVSTLIAAANRDPARFVDPESFDVTREDAKEHLSFSAGRHFCLGAALARMEAVTALRALHERHPDLVVLPGARRRDTRVLRGWATLPVRLA